MNLRTIEAVLLPMAVAALSSLPGCATAPGMTSIPSSLFPPAAAASASDSKLIGGVDPQDISRMLTSSDPKLCNATSDASYAEMAGTFFRVALIAGSEALMQSRNDEELQQKLDGVRPELREISRKTAWLPIDAERSIGDRIYERNKFETYMPPKRQQPLVDNTLKPMFEALSAYAANELKSPFRFEMRLVRDDAVKTPSMIAGGIMLVPSGMLNAVSSLPSPDPMIAFMMAHEFSHALRRHYTKKLQLTLVEGLTQAAEFRKVANTQVGRVPSTNIQQLFTFSSENVQSMVDGACKARNWAPLLEQRQEFEADVCGALLLKKLGDATGRRFRAIDGYTLYVDSGLAVPAEKEAEGQCMVEASHPQPKERSENIAAYTLVIDGPPAPTAPTAAKPQVAVPRPPAGAASAPTRPSRPRPAAPSASQAASSVR